MTTDTERHAAAIEVPALRDQVRTALLAYEHAVDLMVAAPPGSAQERYWRQRARHWHETAELLRAKLNRVRAVAEGRPWLRLA